MNPLPDGFFLLPLVNSPAMSVAMPPIRFSVSQVSVAATCPRILNFDALQTRNNPTGWPRVTHI